MKTKLFAALAVLVTSLANADVLTILSDRTELHMRPIIQQFEHQTGHTVRAIFTDEGGMAARLSARPDEADLIVTTDIVALELAKRKGFTQALQSRYIKDVAPQFRDPDLNYVALSYRARTMVVKADALESYSGYSDLSSGKFRVCMRPLNHAYNINLLSQMVADVGEAEARRWYAGVRASLSMTPTGNDRKQAEFVAQDQCDVSLMNTYYFGLLQTSRTQRQVAQKVSLFFPNQAQRGTYVLESGAAPTKRGNVALASQFVDFMLSPLGQAFVANSNFEYPVLEHNALPQMVQSFAEGQPGIEKGRAKLNFVDVRRIADSRERALAIINEIK